MDKRSIATRKKIRDTYISMLINKEPINVRAIVKKANINKSTFYRYYTYLEELEDELILEVVKDAHSSCATPTTNDATFAEKFFDYIENMDDRSRAIFYRNVPRACDMFVSIALEGYKKKEDNHIKQLIFYIISSGCMQLFVNRKYGRAEKKEAIVELGKAYGRIAAENKEEK